MYEPTARILWMLSPIPPAVFEIMAHLAVSKVVSQRERTQQSTTRRGFGHGFGHRHSPGQRIVNAFNAVGSHCKKKTGGQLRIGGSGVEESGRGVSKVLFGQQVVRFDGSLPLLSRATYLNVVAVDANGHSHQHLLRTLCDPAIQTQQVTSLQSLEAKVVVIKISFINNSRVEGLGMTTDACHGFIAADEHLEIPYHGRRLPVLWVDIGIEFFHGFAELFVGFLV